MIGDLFELEPATWGLRGDPYLWRELRDDFAATPLPRTPSEFVKIVEDAFQALTGRPLLPGDAFLLEKHAHGGMSGGGISPEFWYEKALPLLLERYLAATREGRP